MSLKSEKGFVTFWQRQGQRAHDVHGWVRKHGLDC